MIMEHVFDIETAVFEQIKEHQTIHLTVPKEGRDIKPFDTLKLYHPGEDVEALRIEVTNVIEENETDVTIEFQLLEWMFQMETELDELLREEKKWEGLL